MLYQHFTSFDPLLQISAPRHLILQVRAIQTKDQATRNGGVHLEEQEKQARQKVAGTAQKNKKNGKSRKAAATTTFPLLLHAAAKTPKNGYKGRGPEHSTTKPLHSHSIHPSHIHHSTENLHPFHLSPYSSVATKTDRRLKQEHHEHHQELLQEFQDGQGSKDLKAKLSLNLFFLCHDSNISAFFYFLCHGKPSVTNNKSLSFPSCSVICCVILRCKTV
jgi:hypothetical protein